MTEAKEKTESKKATIVIGAFGDAGKCKELVADLKKAKFDGAKLIKSGRFTYVAAGECEKGKAPELIEKLKAAGFKGYELTAKG